MRIETPRKTIQKKSVQKRKKEYPAYLSGIIISVSIIIIGGIVYFFLRETPDLNYSKAIGATENQVQLPDASSRLVDSDNGDISITKAVFSPEYIDGKDFLKVVAEAKKPTGMDQVNFRYEWKINGHTAGDGSDRISGFKRGDKVSVRITPYAEDKIGRSVTLDLQIANSTPGVFGGKELVNDGKTFSYQINAQDPDGDQLSYELLSGPEGMTIDRKSGVVNWPFKEGDNGAHQVKVKITDGQGGEIAYQLTATTPKKSP